MMAGAALTTPNTRNRDVQQTLQHLDSSFHDTSLASLTGLGIAEVRELKQEIATIFPASNLPAFLLQGLVQLQDRVLNAEQVAADLKVLFRGSRQIGVYGTFLAAPALVLYGYQRLLTLAGKDADSAFPNGPWHFYTEFGLREDTAHHCVETIGFQTLAPEAREVDAATCWIAAAMRVLFAYDDLLANEWHERMALRAIDVALHEHATHTLGRKAPRKEEERERLIAERVEALRQEYHLQRLATLWAAQRPYAGPPGEPLGNYPAYRRSCFEQFLHEALRSLPSALRTAADQQLAAWRRSDQPAYQEQMSLLKTLYPESFREQPTALALELTRVALVVRGRYYLLPTCDRDAAGNLLVFPLDGMPDSPGVALQLSRASDGSWRDRYNHPVQIDRRGRVRVGGAVIGGLRPPPLNWVKRQVAAILRQARPYGPGEASDAPPTDLFLAQAPRNRQSALRNRLPTATQSDLATLRYAPVIINWDWHDGRLPLAELRRTHRGCGDHALTVIKTDRSVVFDLSHIFFDGTWSMALAEIMTGFACAVYPLVRELRSSATTAPPALNFAAPAAFLEAARSDAALAPVEVAAETTAINLKAIHQLRRRLAERKVELTVNDILLLARCAHAANYQPGPVAQATLVAIEQLANGPQLRQQIEDYMAEQRLLNPAILIPMDASGVDPRLRIYPATFRNPLTELLPRLARCNELLASLGRYPDAALRRTFEEERKMLFTELLRFGMLLRSLRQVTMRGESFTTAALRLMAHLPIAMQNLVDLIPQKFAILNEIVKGTEVFSNVGQVVATSSLTRFISSRDDGETKTLVWGVMSNASGQLCVSLRDFRPHVAPLVEQQRGDLAGALAQDFADAYAECANDLVKDVQRVFSFK